MTDEIKSKLQKLDNIRIYANNNVEFLGKDMGSLKSEIYAMTQDVYKDPRAIDELMNSLELDDEGREQTATLASTQLRESPDKVGRLKGSLFGLGGDPDAKEKASELGGMLVKYKDLLMVHDGYSNLSQRAMQARKLKPDRLGEELDHLHDEREYADAQRDTRIKDRTWSPWDDKLKHLDKGLQMSPEEREKAKTVALEEELENPLSRY